MDGSMTLKESLLGKHIRSVFLIKDALLSDQVHFLTNEGPVTWQTHSECCSTTWIEHVDFELLGGEVYDVLEDGLPPEWYKANPGLPEEDSLSLYGITIRSAKGTGTIDFRNESNGSYSGNMHVVEA